MKEGLAWQKLLGLNFLIKQGMSCLQLGRI